MRLLRGLLPITGVAMLATACGSAASANGGSSPATTISKPKVHLSPAKMVDRMVLHSGDLLNFNVRSKTVETLKDQLSRPSERDFKTINRLTRASWLASEHSVIVANPNFPVVDDVNLFRSARWVTRLWAADLVEAAGEAHALPVPAGSPPGAIYDTGAVGKYRIYRLGWHQGRVIGQTFMIFHKGFKFSPAFKVEMASVLARAAAAESGRIAAALSL